jgi:tetratricopeptide (TPR) repeat protein
VSQDRTSALRPLHQATADVAVLRAGAPDPEVRQAAILRVIEAVEWTLRRVLRDDPVAPLKARLSALAPDEIRPDEVLNEVRQHDLITIELAAALHHLFELRQRITGGATPSDADVVHAVSVVDLLEEEVGRVRAAPAPASETLLDEQIHEVPSDTHRTVQRPDRRTLTVVGAAALLLVLIFVGVRLFSGSGASEMDQGIALFRSGAYADAAHHFYRYAERNPRDATPHLYLARIHRRLGRPDLAGPALQEAMRLSPDDAAVHRELGFLLMDTGRYDVSVERFRTAVSMDENSPEGWMGLVLALRRAGRPGEAERVLARAPAAVRQRFERQPETRPDDL